MKQATLFVAAACPSADVHLAKVMSQIKNNNPSVEFRFIGIGGPEMGHEGLESLGVDSSAFIFKPFFPIKNYYRKATEIACHPVHMYTRWVNKQVLNKMEEKYFSIIQHHHPLAYLTCENEFFMMGFYRKIREQYRFYNKICPPTFYYGLTQANQPHIAQKYLDHMFTRVQMPQTNYERFIFPHTQVGADGVYQAYRYLLSQSSKYKDLVEKDLIYLPQGELFRFDEFIADRVQELRNAHRKQQGFGDQDLLIFVAAGNSAKEIPFGLKQAAEGIKRFLAMDEMKNFPKESVKIIISVPEFVEMAALTKKTISSLKWPTQVIQVEAENTKFAAMASSDIGIVMNGQTVTECAAFQLPTLIMDPKPVQHSYFTQLYNSFDYDLNLANQGTVYPELIMQTIPNKIAYSILEHVQDPKLRYFYAKQYAKILQAQLAKSSEQAPDYIQDQFKSVQLKGFCSAYQLMAHTVMEGAHAYKHIHAKTNNTTSQNDSLRVEALQELGWAKGL